MPLVEGNQQMTTPDPFAASDDNRRAQRERVDWSPQCLLLMEFRNPVVCCLPELRAHATALQVTYGLGVAAVRALDARAGGFDGTGIDLVKKVVFVRVA